MCCLLLFCEIQVEIMDEAAGELKLALPSVLDSLQVQVEVHQKSNSTANVDEIRSHVTHLLNKHSVVFGDYTWTEFDGAFLVKNVNSVAIVDTELKVKARQPIDLSKCNVIIHVFHLNDEGPIAESLEEDNEDLVAANHWILPAVEFNGLWESLIFDNEVKTNLLDYVTTTLLFSDKNINSNLISWNRVVLLHGPPGTGKTSLCKAMAQKLAIRLSHRSHISRISEIEEFPFNIVDGYRFGQLIEINSHSLFSKWFSESGKLVTKMFQKIHELIVDKDVLVFVLIDEVESLTAARNASRVGTEPSDALRVVNAVLTQIDHIKRFPNVVILTTSNITEKIDMAFVDRADIKQYIGPPSSAAIFNIYMSCIEELMKCQIIYPRQQLLTLRDLEMIGYVDNNVSNLSLLLNDISRKSEGLSGRVLRKLPFLAHALFIQSPTVTIEKFLQALSLTVDRQFEERKTLKDST
ncbi:pachytene checkpoint protein 2 homolog isoform X5 [Hyperolius riggenbachi]|uniref:pachytene checkpoint protein 2 homolog isoform X5 n=1 Tax=Hyperolius riggenbachi TaxID=752182 RepID=UPI0035A3B63A